MTDIFYTEVDRNLQQELNTRGASGYTGQRLTDNLNFMHGKIANVIMLAYEDGTSTSKIISTLGGMEVRNGRYVPTSTPNLLDSTDNDSNIGYATNLLFTKETVIFEPTQDNKAQKAKISSSLHYDETGRFGPGITEVTVDIGDHSMGLLNKATVNIIVPNPTRDLDTIEKYWLRPGRYAKIEIHHPDDAILTTQKLKSTSLPNEARIKQLHPNWDTSDYEKSKKMNVFQFEGLITSFTLEYTTTGQVEITLSLTGTSNIYPDISMYLPSTQTGNSVKVKTPNSEKIELETKAVASNTGSTADTTTQLYDFIDNVVSQIENTIDPDHTSTILSRFYITGYDNTQYTDHHVLFGEPYPSVTTTPDPNKPATTPTTERNRYITLGALVYIINNFILKQKLASNIPFTELICDDSICFSHYLENLISTDPTDVLLLPKQLNSDYDMNTYGSLKYYSNIKLATETNWPGIYEKTSSGEGVVYPSRIFINLKVLERQLDVLSKKNTKTFTLKSFMSYISNTIKTSTAEAIDMKLMSLPTDLNKLLFTDTKYVKIKPILEYSVPMFANHPVGTIVKQFSLTSKLPSNVQSLAYVLNQGEDATEEQIAPFVNVMYSSDNAEKLEKNLKLYQDKHAKYITKLRETRIEFGKSPKETKYITALTKALADHLKYPTNSIKQSQQLMAPIFPFDASFTIDGINGFRYGDVVTFEALPLKYRVNTVFSIIGIKQNVNTSGIWTTEIRCIMRPKIG